MNASEIFDMGVRMNAVAARAIRAEPRVLVEHVNPPIPVRSHDYRAWFDGQEESGPTGEGATAADALDDLKDNLDAWECCDCGGYGRREEYCQVGERLSDVQPLMVGCKTCGELGHCGPDAEKRAAVIEAKAKP